MEREFHGWLKQQPERLTDFIKIGIGDDAAVLDWGQPSQPGIVLTTDAIAEGTHFELAQHSLSQIGRKAMAVNLSDIAAMGATPIAALLTLMLPHKFSLEHAQSIFLGCQQLAHQFETGIVGGDTNRWNGPLVVSVTMIGREFINGGKPASWTLDGAQPGDLVVVSGTFGGSIYGRHLDFEPRIELAQYLAENYIVNAATDASDSLSQDLASIAEASNLGVEVELQRIPLSQSVQQHFATDQQLEHALTDGEDFELIFAIAPEQWAKMKDDECLPEQLTAIGRFSESRDFVLIDPSGNCTLFQPTGYSH